MRRGALRINLESAENGQTVARYGQRRTGLNAVLGAHMPLAHLCLESRDVCRQRRRVLFPTSPSLS